LVRLEGGRSDAIKTLTRCLEIDISSQNCKKNLEVVRYRLGERYLNGKDGSEKNIFKAIALFEVGAKDDFSDSQIILAWIYLNGVGVTKNYEKSKVYCNQVLSNSKSNDAQRKYASDYLSKMN
jgi:TPR repeat protein